MEEKMEEKKKINVNLWDDYCQKPYHPYNETTRLVIEDSHMSDEDVHELREALMQLCDDWLMRTGRMNLLKIIFKTHDIIIFSRAIDKRKIDIINLSSDSRRELYSFLANSGMSFKGRKINFIMES